MYSIHSTYVADCPDSIAEQCRKLCHDDSEMQQLFGRIASGSVHEHERRWVIAYAWIGGNRSVVTVVGWASATDWFVANDTRRQVQVFVAKEHRGSGIGTALCACLGDLVTKYSGPVCVFSPRAMAIAKRLGWKADQYKSTDDGWIGVGSTDGRRIGTGHDDAGLHAPAPEVRSVPLASDEAGEAT